MTHSSLARLVALAFTVSTAVAVPQQRPVSNTTAPAAAPAAALAAAPAAVRASILTKVEDGICAECKVSPYTLSLNGGAYDYGENVTIVAWTEGEAINCDKTWLKTNKGCWVSQWDLVTFNGNYRTALRHETAPTLQITKKPATTKYKSECYSMNERAADVSQRIKMYKENVDITMICQKDGYFKTTSDCFVERPMVKNPGSLQSLPDCGPQPFFKEPKMRDPDPSDTSCPPKKTTFITAKKANPPRRKITRRYLGKTTIGEEYGRCRSCARTNCSVKKTYNFDAAVNIQCYTPVTTGNFLLTTDFCYLNETDVDYQVHYESYMFPRCEDFVDTK